MKKISIVVPCYNEEDVLDMFYDELNKILKEIEERYSHEIIFVNDGSKDNTLNILRELRIKDETIRIINFSRNFGKEAAMYAGLSNSIGDLVVLMDADLQHPPKTILKMLQEIENGYDVAATRRKNRRGEPFITSICSKMFYRLMKHFIPVEQGVQDFRMMTREVVDAVVSLKEYNRFSKGIFSWVGYKIKYISIDNVKRPVGKSKWGFGKLFSYAIDGIVSFTTSPLKIATVIGAVTSFLSMIFAIEIVAQTLIFGKDTPGYASTITVILFIGGVQLLTIGILSRYVSEIYMEIKGRPKYIEKKIEEREEIKDENDS